MEGEDAIYRGVSDVRRFWDEWHDLWRLDIDMTEVRDLGDTVLAFARVTSTGGASGAAVEQSIGYVFEFDGPLIRRARAYLSVGEALEAVGLSE
jgi:hypothetical protein